MAGSEAAGAGGRRGEEEAAAAGAAPHMARPAERGGEAGRRNRVAAGGASARTSGERRRLRPGLAGARAPAAQAPHVVGFPRMHLPRPPPAHRPAPSAPRALGSGLRGRPDEGCSVDALAVETRPTPSSTRVGAERERLASATPGVRYSTLRGSLKEHKHSIPVIAFSAPQTADDWLLLCSTRFLPKVCWA